MNQRWENKFDSLNVHVGFVLLAVDDAQKSGRLLVFEVQSHIIHSSNCKMQHILLRTNWNKRFGTKNVVFVHFCSAPVPFRHCSVVVKPLVRGRRWYLSTGRPLLSATCMLIWCFFSVNRVPSQYSRNCAKTKKLGLHTPGIESTVLVWPLLSCHNHFA